MPHEAVGEALIGCSLPAGQIYTLGDEAGEGKASDEALFRVLFEGYEEGMHGVEASAVYLSARENICELAVFLCYGDTKDTLNMCLKRGDFLSRYEPNTHSLSMVKGRYVLFAAGENPNSLLDALGRALDK